MQKNNQLNLYQLAVDQPALRSKQTADRKTKQKAGAGTKDSVPVQNATDPAYSKIYIQLVIDCADVLIPAASLQWLAVEDVYVGLAGSLTSIIAGRDVWAKVQARPPPIAA